MTENLQSSHRVLPSDIFDSHDLLESAPFNLSDILEPEQDSDVAVKGTNFAAILGSIFALLVLAVSFIFLVHHRDNSSPSVLDYEPNIPPVSFCDDTFGDGKFISQYGASDSMDEEPNDFYSGFDGKEESSSNSAEFESSDASEKSQENQIFDGDSEKWLDSDTRE